MTPKTLGGVLEELVRIIGYEFNKSTYESETKHIAQAHAEIVGLLPKEININKLPDMTLRSFRIKKSGLSYRQFCEGWNAYRKQTLINFREKGEG